MKRKQHTPGEIIKRLREAATLPAGGQAIEEVCKKLEAKSADLRPMATEGWRGQRGDR